ncbi:DEAD/DEAH box helicase, partial [Candidatus Woesearchaeota archaeon]|nr:DEAD/DEAH box helicase [Candidatus Woesearchaeota archaeon]
LVRPGKRQELWQDAKIIFSTPQGLENDVISGRILLEEVSLLVFDEAHRAVGDYAYSFIAKQYSKKARYPRVLGLTASPGSDMEKISEVCKNLHIEDIEIRIDSDPDVLPYVQQTKIEWVNVELPQSFKQIKKHLQDCFKSKLAGIRKHGYANSMQNMGKVDLLKFQAMLHAEISKGNKDYKIMLSISVAAEAIKIQHALELLETQGITPLYEYLEKLQTESLKTKVKAVKNLVKDLNFRSALIRTRNMYEAGVEHPKLAQLKKIIEEEIKNNEKIIIFNQYRGTASKIVDEINAIEGVKAKLFVGQAKRKVNGLSQKEQKSILNDFREGKINCLVSTSVGEEGLDIPKVDLVIFYEPVPSAIRHIQRRGRTGRLEKGKVIVLMTKDTRDVGYKWSAHRKERLMYKTLETLKSKLNKSFLEPKETQSLKKFIAPEEDIKIIADDREKSSGITKELIDIGVDVELKRLDVADYILSKRVGVEHKNVADFVDSIIDGRLLQQIKDLKQNFERPLIIVEGEEDIFSQRSIHPNAIRGMLATIAVSYGIPVLQTKNFKDTSALLAVIAKREQDETGKYFSPHGSRKPLTLKEQQEYIVSALPGVGATLATPLLKQFGSVKGVVNAPEEELKKIDKIGEKKAKEIQKVLNEKYY